MSERDETREAVARAIYEEMEGPVANQDYARQMRQWDLAKSLAASALKAMTVGSRFTVEGVECVVFPKPDESLLWKMTEILGEWIMDQKTEDDVFRAMLRACEEKGDGR